jgi:hypothetical protein
MARRVFNILAIIVAIIAVAGVVFGIVYAALNEKYVKVGGTQGVLKVGNKVQYRFKACPTAINVAAFGVDGNENHVLTDLAIQSCKFCDLPGSAGTKSIWVGNAGLDYRNDAMICASVTKYLSTLDLNSCKEDADCNEVEFPCDPAAGNCSISIFGSPLYTECKADDKSLLGGYCDLSKVDSASIKAKIATIEKTSSLSFHCTDINESGVGTCRVKAECPPPAMCYAGTKDNFKVPNSNQTVGMCSTLDQSDVLPNCKEIAPGVMDPTCPCTGCAPGQTCQYTPPAFGAKLPLGTCTGQAIENFIVTKVDFLAEGEIVTISDLDGTFNVRWDNIQCIYPFVNPKRGPGYYLGCVISRTVSDDRMVATLFGAQDPVTGTYKDAYGPPVLTYGSKALANLQKPGAADPLVYNKLPWYLPCTFPSLAPNSMRRVRNYTMKMGAPYSFPPKLTMQSDFFASITFGIDPDKALA